MPSSFGASVVSVLIIRHFLTFFFVQTEVKLTHAVSGALATQYFCTLQNASVRAVTACRRTRYYKVIDRASQEALML